MSEVNNLLKRRQACGGTGPAQAWYNDLLGGTHWVGDKVLRAFGMGNLSDTIAGGEGDALPDWARTDDQKKAHEAELAAQKKQEEKERKDAEAAKKQLAEQRTREAEEQKHRLAEEQKHQLTDEQKRRLAEDHQQAQAATVQIREAEQHQREAMDQLAQQILSQPPAADPEPRAKPSRPQKPGQSKQRREQEQ